MALNAGNAMTQVSAIATQPAGNATSVTSLNARVVLSIKTALVAASYWTLLA